MPARPVSPDPAQFAFGCRCQRGLAGGLRRGWNRHGACGNAACGIGSATLCTHTHTHTHAYAYAHALAFALA